MSSTVIPSSYRQPSQGFDLHEKRLQGYTRDQIKNVRVSGPAILLLITSCTFIRYSIITQYILDNAARGKAIPIREPPGSY